MQCKTALAVVLIVIVGCGRQCDYVADLDKNLENKREELARLEGRIEEVKAEKKRAEQHKAILHALGTVGIILSAFCLDLKRGKEGTWYGNGFLGTVYFTNESDWPWKMIDFDFSVSFPHRVTDSQAKFHVYASTSGRISWNR